MSVIFTHQSKPNTYLSRANPLGMLIAKAFLTPEKLDRALTLNKEMKRSLEKIGYSVNISSNTLRNLGRELDGELENTRMLYDKGRRQAEALASVLSRLVKSAVKLKKAKNMPHLAALTELVFLWDELVDFSDFQSGEDATSVRESPFYRAACKIIGEASQESLEKLENNNVDKSYFEIAFVKIQFLNSKKTYTAGNDLEIYRILKSSDLDDAEAVYFLLTLEACLFTESAKEVAKMIPPDKLSLIFEEKNPREAITLLKSLSSLSDDGLEDLLAQKAGKLTLSLTPDIFSRI